jgi:hypothetical protein
MKLVEIKNMSKSDLIEFLDLYGVEFYPDESKKALLTTALDLFWDIRDNQGYTYESVSAGL